MTVEELEAMFRADIRDAKAPYLFTSADFLRFLNEAELQACIRADLLLEEEDADLCTIAVTAPSAIYALHAAVTRVHFATFTAEGSDEPTRLTLITRPELTRLRPRWRERTEPPRELIPMDRKVRFGCIPEENGTLQLEVYRTPLTPMAAADDEPEIAAQHHTALIQWCLYRAYSRPDVERFDRQAADRALAEFERTFGPPPDANLRKEGEIVPQANVAYL